MKATARKGPFTIVVSGGRDFEVAWKLSYHLDALIRKLGPTYRRQERPLQLMSGGAKGADTLAEKYALTREVPIKVIPAEWERYGKSAGFVRNAVMLKQADWLLAFWDGASHGTKHAIDLAEALHVPATVVKY